MNRQKHEGFTLVELLIVMIVIGILSLAMLISSEEVSASARATRLINDLNAWKRAALSYWADNLEKVSEPDFNIYSHTDEIIKYIGVSENFIKDQESNSTKYRVIQSKDGCWYVWCDIGWGNGKINKDLGIRTGVTARLVDRAKSAGLYRATEEDWYSEGERESKTIESEKGNKYYLGTNEDGCGERYIIMKIR